MDSSFNKKLNDAVWSELIEPDEFEAQWNDLMIEFGLNEHKWFKTMYAIRKMWIPAFFRDSLMSGLFKTTSMSESEKGFFGRYASPKSNLIEFFMLYESAFDAQRHAHDHLNSLDEASIPQLKTPLQIEKYAASVYTDKIFTNVQTKIVAACFKCRVASICDDYSCRTYKFDNSRDGSFTAVFNKSDDMYACSCKHFVRFGLLCRHVFVIFKDLDLETIPEKYVLSRWTKLSYSKPLHDISSDVVHQCAEIKNNKLLSNQVVSEFYSCLGLIDGDTDKLNAMLRGIMDLKEAFNSGDPTLAVVSSKHKLFEKFYGASAPEDVNILPPDPVKTKGSCSSIASRLRSNKEKAIEISKKPLRICSKCKQKTNHDARNCPLSRDNDTIQ